jgi:hypothetical protein
MVITSVSATFQMALRLIQRHGLLIRRTTATRPAKVYTSVVWRNVQGAAF